MNQPANVIMSAEHLRSLHLQDKFETEGLFQGVSAEPIKWTLSQVDGGEKFTLRAKYFNISLGTFEAKIGKKDKVSVNGKK